MDFIYSMFLNLCLLLDNMLFGINKLLFDLFMDVAEARFRTDMFESFVNNLYVVIGIFMVFRVAFSLIQMLANPDMLADKEKGAGKIATRIVIALGVIVLVPTIFDLAYNLQSAILSDNIIGKLILGDSGNNDQSAAISSQGQLMSVRIFKGMITISDDVVKGDGNVEKCAAALTEKGYNNKKFHTIDSLRNVDGIDCFTKKSKNVYIYNYKFLVSTIALGMVAWLMVGFCIDIGVRLIKLTFLQLLAPVCAVTYVGGGKDNAFNKWIKMTISSYISVFVKLIIIYFMIFMAGKIDMSELGLNGLGYVCVLLGLLVFAKNATKLIGDLFGIKMDEESGFKGIAKTALLGGAALAAGAATGGVGSMISKAAASRQAGNGWGRALMAGAGGLFGGAIAGGVAGAKDKNLLKAGKSGIGIAQKGGQQTLNNGTTGWWERTGARVVGGLGLQTTGQAMKSRLEALNTYAKGRESIKSIAEGDKNERAYLASIGGYKKVNDYKEAYERAVNSGMAEDEINRRKEQWDAATNMVIDKDMVDETTSIGAISKNLERLQDANKEAFDGMKVATNAKELGENYARVKTQSTVLEQSEEYKRATDIDKAVGKNNK